MNLLIDDISMIYIALHYITLLTLHNPYLSW